MVRSVSIAESGCGEVTRIKSWDMGWSRVPSVMCLNGTVAYFCDNSVVIRAREGG